MNYYLVVYNRRTGELKIDEFGPTERRAALRARFAAEANESDREVEVVVLGGHSREQLARTHARYFASVGGMARGASRALASN